MKSMRSLIAVALVSLSLGACSQDIGMKQGAGGLLGAAGGAWLGSTIGKGGSTGNIIAIAVGTLGGALIGSEIGASLDRIDQMYAERTLNTALNTDGGQPVAWQNPDTGHGGQVQVTGVRQGETGVCKRYEQTIFVDGKSETAVGVACQNTDGTWSIQS